MTKRSISPRTAAIFNIVSLNHKLMHLLFKYQTYVKVLPLELKHCFDDISDELKIIPVKDKTDSADSLDGRLSVMCLKVSDFDVDEIPPGALNSVHAADRQWCEHHSKTSDMDAAIKHAAQRNTGYVVKLSYRKIEPLPPMGNRVWAWVDVFQNERAKRENIKLANKCCLMVFETRVSQAYLKSLARKPQYPDDPRNVKEPIDVSQYKVRQRRRDLGIRDPVLERARARKKGL